MQQSRASQSLRQGSTIMDALDVLAPSQSSLRDQLRRDFAFELRSLRYRHGVSRSFEVICGLAALLALFVLGWLLVTVLWSGLSWLRPSFFTNFPSRFPEQAGIKSAIFGSLWLMGLTAAFAIPVGVGGAVFLEELAPKGRIKKLIDANIANLASVPSIVYGILGLAVFVRFCGFERSVLSGALTLAILILPMIIIATREALLSIPKSIREAAIALGCTPWQATRDHVLPAAFPGVLTGIILSLSRAIGESAPLIMIGAMSFVAFVPEHMFDGFTALPIQIFNWAGRPQEEFHELSAAAIIVLLGVLLCANAFAIFFRNRLQRKNLCQHL